MSTGTGEVVWQPSPARIAAAQVTAFARQVGCGSDYSSLWDWSVRDPGAFWSAVWEFAGVIGARGAVALADAAEMPGARFFPDAELSFAENLLRRRDDREAIVYRCEDGRRRAITFAELHAEVRCLRAALLRAGIGPGDRVAALLPNVPEAVTAMLAAASIGACWSSCSPDFGTPGVLDRFRQIEPKVLFFADGHRYKGRAHAQLPRLGDLLAGLPTVTETVVVSSTGDGEPRDLDARKGVQSFSAFRDSAGGGEPRDLDAPFARFPFDHPLYVLFSSGTTGAPKCIVHGAGGTLLQHLKEHRLHQDLGPDDRLCYFTTTGWMMWNWLVSALASGTTIVLWDGSPFHPRPEALWDMVQQERVTVFGTSAKYLDACKTAGLEPRRTHDLSALRAILSTGSPLVPESFDWVYARVGQDLQLASISGGTDIVSCFALGCPILPVQRGELQCRGLGMKVEIFDEGGHPVVDRPGELVCTAPFPSMPVGFWNDPDGRRFRAAYFERFPGVWHHGDWATLTRWGSLVITGRSDATLNPGGVRIGTAEIYRQVEQCDEVLEALVVGQDRDGDQRIVLFVVLREGLALDDALCRRIRERIRANTTARHVPAVIAQVTDVPRTRSGKISELAVRDVIHGRAVKNTEALANPEALDQFKDRPELGDLGDRPA